MNRVAIAIGSNVGDRLSHVTFAVSRLHASLSNLVVSSWHDTAPVGVGPQPNFLNGAAIGDTSLSARDLLATLLAIEWERGRTRPFAGAPRTLDLDLILFADRAIDEPGLKVPHPRFRERRFVLAPLAEIAADWVDPETRKTVGELLEAVRSGG